MIVSKGWDFSDGLVLERKHFPRLKRAWERCRYRGVRVVFAGAGPSCAKTIEGIKIIKKAVGNTLLARNLDIEEPL